MKKQKFHLICFIIVLVSFIPLASALNYFESDEVFIRANPNVNIQYADDLYWTSFEMDDSTYVRVNDTTTLFNLTSISVSSRTIVFSSSGRNAKYTFSWSSINPYVTSLEGNITTFNLQQFQNSRLILTVSAASSTTSTTLVNCGSRGEPNTINGATSSSFDAGTNVLTLNVTHASSQELELLWGTAGTIVTSLIMAASFTSIVLIAAMFYGALNDKELEYYVGVAFALGVLFVVVLVVAELPILTGV